MATFIAELEGLKLTDEQARKIHSGIQEVVLRTVAGIDTKGDLKINKNLARNPLFKRPPGHTDGIWIEHVDVKR